MHRMHRVSDPQEINRQKGPLPAAPPSAQLQYHTVPGRSLKVAMRTQRVRSDGVPVPGHGENIARIR